MNYTIDSRIDPANEIDLDAKGLAFKTCLKTARDETESSEIFEAIAGGELEYSDKMQEIIDNLIAGKAFELADRIEFALMFEELVDSFVEKKALALEDAHIKSMAENFYPEFN